MRFGFITPARVGIATYNVAMRILGIETSCDETAAAVVEDGARVLSNVIASTKDAFLWSGGVIPEKAARAQAECILPVITQALAQADILPTHLDAVAVTVGPGLLGSLIVGTTTARMLAAVWRKPLLPVHHHLGHLSSVWLTEKSQIQKPKTQTIFNYQSSIPQFPVLTLTVSGGHTELWLRTAHTSGQLLGRTRDDAAGEAFDKGACLLGLPYPGGPAIAKAAESGNPNAFAFPHPLHSDSTLDFSFSGLKTSLKYLLRDLGHSPIPPAYPILQPTTYNLADVAASYQHAICRHLCDRTAKALAQFPHIKEIHLVGGVSANIYLRKLLQESTGQCFIRWPTAIEYCTDNAAMIAAAAEFLVAERGWPDTRSATDPSLPLTGMVENG